MTIISKQAKLRFNKGVMFCNISMIVSAVILRTWSIANWVAIDIPLLFFQIAVCISVVQSILAVDLKWAGLYTCYFIGTSMIAAYVFAIDKVWFTSDVINNIHFSLWLSLNIGSYLLYHKGKAEIAKALDDN